MFSNKWYIFIYISFYIIYINLLQKCIPRASQSHSSSSLHLVFRLGSLLNVEVPKFRIVCIVVNKSREIIYFICFQHDYYRVPLDKKSIESSNWWS